VSDRDALDGHAFLQRQLVVVFTRGSRFGREELTRHLNWPLYAGAAAALVAVLVVCIVALVSRGPPRNWMDDGTLVVDRASGGRYVAVRGSLRPVANMTSLLLLKSGQLPEPVRVSHDLLVRQPQGPPLGIPDAPELPPPARAASPPWTACQRRGDPVVHLVVNRPGVPAQPQEAAFHGVLTRRGGDRRIHLVTDSRAYPIGSLAALGAMGYAGSDVRIVPGPWLDLAPRGPVLAVQRLPGRGTPPGAPGFMADGSVVVDRASGQRFLAAGGRLHAVGNGSSLALLTGGRPVRPVVVDHAVLTTQPQGAPFGIQGAPDVVPPVPPGSSPLWACTPSAAGGEVQVLERLPVPQGFVARTPGPPGAGGGTAAARFTVWQAPGDGLLARAPGPVDREISADDPVVLVTGGRALRIVSQDALRALGYARAPVAPVPRPWLAALPQGPSLEVIRP
jgi:hypothetical protein